MEKLRRKNEEFMRVLLNLNKTDLARICSIDPQFSRKKTADQSKSKVARSVLSKNDEMPNFRFGTREQLGEEGETGSEPRFFLARTGVIGLIPHSARQWDMVYQFCLSDSVAIKRKKVTIWELWDGPW
jgi:hypothetical protein